jgi:hypothetical protein
LGRVVERRLFLLGKRRVFVGEKKDFCWIFELEQVLGFGN